jgi:outer membrane protein OmpA-like peptidoglycan-associated protein/uncharacterized protein YegL
MMKYKILNVYGLLFLCFGLWNCQKLPVIESFSTRNVIQGKDAKLSWKVSKAQKIYLIDHQNQDQSIELALSETTYSFSTDKDFKFTLVAERNGKKIQKTAQGKVLKDLPTISFFKGSTQYTVGQAQAAFLEWKVSNAKLIYLTKYAYDLKPTDKIDIRPDSTTNFEIVAIGKFNDTVRAVHQIKTEKFEGGMSFGVSELLAGNQETLTWDFPGASWVMLKGIKDTLKAKGSHIFTASLSASFMDATFFIKYPNKNEILERNTRIEIVPVKFNFKPSKLKLDGEEEVRLYWETKGAKKIDLVIGDKIFEGQDAKGTYDFFPKENVEVKLIVLDKANRSHQTSWLIKCENRRPFIKNAIDYQTFKKRKSENKQKTNRLITEIFQVDRSNYPQEVKLKVLVSDTLGNFIKGLAPPSVSEQESKKFFLEIIEKTDLQTYTIKDFKVKEVNEIQSQPYDIALCLDYSGSMVGTIQAMEQVIQKFINRKEANDRFSIIKFDDQLKKVSSMEIDENKLLQLKWNGLDDFGGSTALYAGIDEALESFVNQEPNRQKILFVFTDGAENSSFQHFEKRLFTASDVVKKARKMNVRVYPLGFGDGTNYEILQLVGWLTDGKAYQVLNTNEIDSVYSELPRIFKNYYEISYKTPANAPKTISGRVDLKLKYNNQVRITQTSSIYQTHENFSLGEEEGYLPPQKKQSKNTIVAPQAVAFFDFDKYNLKLHYTKSIESIAQYLLKNPNAKIDILGHTDLVGTPEKNLDLSQKRAEEVAAYLIQKGITRDRMVIVPLGETKPIWNPEQENWQSQENRRIEIMIWE